MLKSVLKFAPDRNNDLYTETEVIKPRWFERYGLLITKLDCGTFISFKRIQACRI